MDNLSVVVVSYNSAQWLPQCLGSLLSGGEPAPTIYLVDNASTDGSAGIVRSQFPNVEVIESATNLGFAGGSNLGLRASATDVVVLVNPDVIAPPSSLVHLAKVLRSDPKIAIAGGKLLYPDRQTIQHAGGKLSYPLALADHHGYAEADRGQHDEAREVDYVIGAFLAVKKSVLDEIGYFDEGFCPAYFEETDLCYRARQAGYRVVYAAQAVAIHHESVTTGKTSRQYYHLYHRNRIRFVLKHYSEEQIWRDFLLAEVERLRVLDSDVELAALRQAYAENLAVLEDRADFIANPKGASRLPVSRRRLEMLRVLESNAESVLASRNDAGSVLRDRLAKARLQFQLVEPSFVSSTPVVGPLIVTVRRLWNWMSTKWYVKGVIDQQNQFNTFFVESLRALDLSMQAMESSIIERERTAVRLNTDLTILENRLRRIEQQLTDGEQPQKPDRSRSDSRRA